MMDSNLSTLVTEQAVFEDADYRSTIVDEYVSFIMNSLPQWNYLKESIKSPLALQIEKEKLGFKKEAHLINTALSEESQLSALAQIIEAHVPDNNIQITTPLGNKIYRDTCAISFEEITKDLGVEIVRQHRLIGQNYIASSTLKNKKIGVVSLPDSQKISSYSDEQYFLKTFIEECDSSLWTELIFDFRNATDANTRLVQHIATYLNKGKTIKLADKIIDIESSPANETQDKKSHQNKNMSFKNSSHFAFKGKIFILQDRHNSLGAEAAIYMLSQLPNAITVGEQTRGAYQGGALKKVDMSFGKLTIGTQYVERYDKEHNLIKEKKGFTPTILCSASNVCEKVIELINFKNIHHKIAQKKVNPSKMNNSKQKTRTSD